MPDDAWDWEPDDDDPQPDTDSDAARWDRHESLTASERN